MFECPTTGKPLYGMAIENWTGAAPDALIAMHCPKCSGMHEFARADGILAMGGRFARVPAAAQVTA